MDGRQEAAAAGVLQPASYLWAGAPASSGAFLSALQIEDETQVSRATQGEQDNYEMHVRAANIVSHSVEGRAQGCRSLVVPPLRGGGGASGQTTSQETPLERRAVWQLRKGRQIVGHIHHGECCVMVRKGSTLPCRRDSSRRFVMRAKANCRTNQDVRFNRF